MFFGVRIQMTRPISLLSPPSVMRALTTLAPLTRVVVFNPLRRPMSLMIHIMDIRVMELQMLDMIRMAFGIFRSCSHQRSCRQLLRPQRFYRLWRSIKCRPNSLMLAATDMQPLPPLPSPSLPVAFGRRSAGFAIVNVYGGANSYYVHHAATSIGVRLIFCSAPRFTRKNKALIVYSPNLKP